MCVICMQITDVILDTMTSWITLLSGWVFAAEQSSYCRSYQCNHKCIASPEAACTSCCLHFTTRHPRNMSISIVCICICLTQRRISCCCNLVPFHLRLLTVVQSSCVCTSGCKSIWKRALMHALTLSVLQQEKRCEMAAAAAAAAAPSRPKAAAACKLVCSHMASMLLPHQHPAAIHMIIDMYVEGCGRLYCRVFSGVSLPHRLLL